MIDPRLLLLLDKYLGGMLNDEERGELERTLLVSATARQEFWEHARFHSLLARWGQESWGGKLAGKPAGKFIRLFKHVRAARLLAAAAAITIVAGLVFFLMNRPGSSPQRSGVAVLALAVDAVWQDENAPRMVGQVLSPGKIHLLSGLAQIEFFNGTRMLVEGPADVEILDGTRTFCHSGRIRLHVPLLARGFKVDTVDVSVTDLGTEFAMNVARGKSPEVHVFQGLVEMKLPGNAEKPAPLREGNAVRIQKGEFEAIPISPDSFVDEQKLATRAKEASQTAFENWKESTETLRADPAALCVLTFEGEPAWTRTVTNRAAHNTDFSDRADIVGCQWTEGRWPQKRAIQLKGAGDRLRLNVGNSMSAVTLLASLKIDSLPNGYQALLSPDSKQDGTPRWGISNEGCLRFGVASASGKTEPKWEVFVSKPIINSSYFGRWITLATTFDGNVVRHYLNGELMDSGQLRPKNRLSIGVAEIGNWIEPDYRNLPASLDEFLIIGRALSADEIRFHVGNRSRAEL